MLREKGQDGKRDAGIDGRQVAGDLFQLVGFNHVRDIEGEHFQHEASPQDLGRQFQNVFIGASGQPAVGFIVPGLDIQPETIHAPVLQKIEILGGQAVPIGFNEGPQACVSFDKGGALGVKIRATGEIAAGKCHNIAGRSKPLGA